MFETKAMPTKINSWLLTTSLPPPKRKQALNQQPIRSQLQHGFDGKATSAKLTLKNYSSSHITKVTDGTSCVDYAPSFEMDDFSLERMVQSSIQDSLVAAARPKSQHTAQSMSQ
jgi:hypothetical protein